MSNLAARLANLSPEKQALLSLRLKKRSAGAAPGQPALERQGFASPPLSFAQQRLWLLSKLEAGAAYNDHMALALKGPLAVAALQASLGQIARRHESVRATFQEKDGMPVQAIASFREVDLPAIDLSRLARERRQAKVRQIAAEQAKQPFELARGPLLRAALLRCSGQEHVLLLTMHHIITDGWSWGVLLAELTALYEAFSQGRPSPLAELPIQYGDFAHWQREWLQGEVLEDQLAYWRQALQGMQTVLQLPTDRPRPKVQAFGGKALTFEVSRQLTQSLRELGREGGATLFMTLLAAFQALLHRLTGQKDIAVGTPVLGRSRWELEGLIGVFINSVVLRADLSGDPPFSGLLDRVKQAALGAYNHQDLPFEKLVDLLDPQRSLSHSPLFQVMFELQNAPRQKGSFSALRIDALPVAIETTRFDLYLSMEDWGENLRGTLRFNRDLFDASTAQRFLGHYLELLKACTASPQRRLSGMDLLSGPQRWQLVAEWNDTWAGVPPQACLHELIEAQARRRPEAAAVAGADWALSCLELNRRSNQLARFLQDLGAGPEVRVGVSMPRSPQLIVALLGVLKAGAAYLPLDPAYPKQRQAWILQNAGVRALLTQASQQPLLEGVAGTVERVDLGSQWPLIAQHNGDDPARRPDPDNLAYAIYTSGSTGRPKGVQVPHAALVNFLKSMLSRPGLAQGETLLAVTTISFDIAALELFLPLLAGGRVALASRAESADASGLLKRLALSGATAMQATPATWRMLIEGGWPASPGLKALCGGEALPRDLADQLLKRVGLAWNLYGPTETTVWSAACRVWPEKGAVPIGHPIANTQIHAADARLNAVPLGVIGELVIGGQGVARGYLGQPSLTAERHLPDPFSGQAGSRLYKTGDLVRRMVDGRLEFLGRMDHQVKLRGYRIELGEIESVLSRHQGVREAALALREDRPGDPRLVAYVVPRSDPPPPADELSLWLQQSLPEYMAPAAFVFLKALPLTANNKVDRNALPKPEQGRPGLKTPFAAPRTPVEERLALIWSQILGCGRVGRQDSFFELGGHSLLAAQLLARVREAFAAELSLQTLFEAPTVAGLAAALAKRKEQDAPERLPRIQPDLQMRCQPFPLTEVQQAYWIGRRGDFELGSVASHIYLEVESAGLDLQRLGLAVNRLIERHDMLRAVVLSEGRQVVLPQTPPYQIEVLDLRGQDAESADAEMNRVRETMSHQVSEGDQWPLFEVRATRLDEGRLRLHLSFDLLIGDAWSSQILYRELALFYADPEAALADLNLTFRDYVLAEQRLRETPPYQRSLEYWRGRVKTLPAAPELPLKRKIEDLGQPRFVRRRAELPAERWGEMKARSSRAGLTPSGLLLAAFSEVLATWSKKPRFTLNLTLFNRIPLHPQVDEIVGDFTSLTLLEVDQSAGGNFQERAKRIQQRLWQDLDHRLVSGVRVLRELTRASGGSSNVTMPVVFTSTLNLSQAEQEAVVQDLQFEVVYGITQTPQVWLDHQAFEQDGRLIFNWDALEELFPPGLLDDMFSAYGRLLTSLSESGEAWAQQTFPLLSPTELEWRAAVNATQAPVPEGLLYSGFLSQAERRPRQPAVVTSRRSLTYGELRLCANQIGHRLREGGARPNTQVAVVMEKGWEQVAAVLGTLISGAAYVPIDAKLPRERLWQLVERSEARFALTQPWLEQRLEWPQGVRRIVVDGQMPEAGIEPLAPLQKPEDLAYLIYTSGSTGQPKGVMIDHRGALNTIADVNRRFEVASQDRLLGLSSLSFDLSVYDIFGTLSAGGTLVLPEPAASRDPRRWAELISQHGVTVWNSVPALMQMLVEWADQGPSQQLQSLRLVLLSGDWIPVGLPEKIRSVAEAARLISLGGATEASIWSILYPIGAVDPDWPSIPYGKPMANQRFHVLNHALQPCPLHVPGELYIGGIGLALGYFRNQARTAQSFFNHPQTGERLYRTRDLGRYLPSGDIEFLGREDNQVKIQGYRVELGEIEATLRQLKGVRRAAVALQGENHHRRLVAYVIPDSDLAAGLDARAQLPDQQLLEQGAEEMEFRLQQRGLRQKDGHRTSVELFKPRPDTRFLAPFRRRRSHRQFLDRPLSFEDLGRLLSPLSEAGGGGNRIQALICLKPGRLEGIAPGTYLCHPADARLEKVSPHSPIDPRAYAAVNHPVVEQAAFAIFLICEPGTIRQAYPSQAREQALIEAGAMGQLLMEEAPASGIGLCPMGAVDFDRLRADLGVSGSCVLVHSLLGGAVAGGQASAEKPAPPAARHQGTQPEQLCFGPLLASPARFLGQAEKPRDPGDFLDRPLSFEALGRFLSCLTQARTPESPWPKYRYPSAGGLYPVQTYVSIRPEGIEGLKAGIYYHHPQSHRLVLLHEDPKIPDEIYADDDREALGQCACTIFLVAKLSAIAPIYGDSWLDFCLLEAGYMSLLLTGAARESGIGLHPAGPIRFERIFPLFDLEEDQILMHGLLAGPVKTESDGIAFPAADEESAPSGLATAGAGEPALPRSRQAFIDRLRDGLEKRLPDYMVPASFILLDSLPLTANGKVDYKALRRQEPAARPAAPYRAPRSKLERAIAQIWKDLLRTDKVGVNDNFFELGGNSLLMIQLRQRFKQDLEKEVRVTTFFEHPTVASLAEALDGDHQGQTFEEVDHVARRHREALKRQALKSREAINRMRLNSDG